MVKIASGLLLAGALLVVAPAAPAADEPYALELYNESMSPYCPGRTLMDCPSEQAAELRGWIADQERAGRPRGDVEAELYQRYGDVILQAPRAEGFGLAAYLLPLAAFLAGGAIVWLFLRRQAAGRPAWLFLRRQAAGRPVPAAPGPRAPLDPELERRIDEELRA